MYCIWRKSPLALTQPPSIHALVVEQLHYDVLHNIKTLDKNQNNAEEILGQQGHCHPQHHILVQFSHITKQASIITYSSFTAIRQALTSRGQEKIIAYLTLLLFLPFYMWTCSKPQTVKTIFCHSFRTKFISNM